MRDKLIKEALWIQRDKQKMLVSIFSAFKQCFEFQRIL